MNDNEIVELLNRIMQGVQDGTENANHAQDICDKEAIRIAKKYGIEYPNDGWRGFKRYGWIHVPLIKDKG